MFRENITLPQYYIFMKIFFVLGRILFFFGNYYVTVAVGSASGGWISLSRTHKKWGILIDRYSGFRQPLLLINDED
jgi:hypothetical protein